MSNDENCALYYVTRTELRDPLSQEPTFAVLNLLLDQKFAMALEAPLHAFENPLVEEVSVSFKDRLKFFAKEDLIDKEIKECAQFVPMEWEKPEEIQSLLYGSCNGFFVTTFPKALTSPVINGSERLSISRSGELRASAFSWELDEIVSTISLDSRILKEARDYFQNASSSSSERFRFTGYDC